MTTTEIKTAVMNLNKTGLSELLDWLEEYQESLWDKQIEEDSNSHYEKSRRIMGRMKFETIEHEREKMLPAIKINITS